MTRALLVGALLTAGCATETITATVTSALTGAPMASLTLKVRAQSEVAFSCQVFEDTTNAEGVATISGPCLSSSAYGISSGNPSLWLAGDTVVPKGSDGNVAITALHAPSGSGAYLLTDNTLTPLSTHGDIKRVTIADSPEVVEYPSRIPSESDIPRVDSGSFLVLVGVENVETARLVPLVKSGPRRLGKGDGFINMNEWWYMGVRFASDTEFTRQAAMVDESKVTRRQEGDRAAYIVPFDGVPAGRYALKTGGSNRVTVMDFGPPAE